MVRTPRRKGKQPTDGLVRNGLAHTGREIMINGETGEAYPLKSSLDASTINDFTTCQFKDSRSFTWPCSNPHPSTNRRSCSTRWSAIR